MGFLFFFPFLFFFFSFFLSLCWKNPKRFGFPSGFANLAVSSPCSTYHWLSCIGNNYARNDRRSKILLISIAAIREKTFLVISADKDYGDAIVSTISATKSRVRWLEALLSHLRILTFILLESYSLPCLSINAVDSRVNTLSEQRPFAFLLRVVNFSPLTLSLSALFFF